MKKNIRKIKVIIADASFSSRKGFATLIGENSRFDLVAETSSMEGLTGILQKKHADVLLVNYCCGVCFAPGAIKETCTLYPDLKVLVVSHKKPLPEIEKMITIGIKNYILQDSSGKEIIQAIETCAEGTLFFSREIIDTLLEKDFSEKNVDAKLSKREKEIIQLIAEGLTGKEIAEKLFLSFHTIHSHRKNISKKLHIKSNAELIFYAMQAGLISLGR